VDAFVHSRVDLTAAQQTAVALWVAHTYIFEHFNYTPKLFATAPMPGVGKTELMLVAEALSYNGIKRQGSTTESAISRMYDARGAFTLCLDQLDGMDAAHRKLINTLCDGFEVGAMKEMSAVGSDGNYSPKEFVIGFPQALGMIGELPDAALASRCITIRMMPAAPERLQALLEAQRIPLVDKKRKRAPLPVALEWRQRLAGELQPHAERWQAWRPLPAPCQCEPRTVAMWQPLFAVAEHFGGEWPARAREAFIELAGASTAKEQRFLAFLRHTIKMLPEGAPPIITPTELRSYVGAGFDGGALEENEPGRLLGKAGVASTVRRWKGRPHPDGRDAPWRAYEVAHIREAARRWRVGEGVTA
jgi:hypothetical protein